MRIAYLVSEYSLWGRHGGYGTITRALAEGMAQRGHEVFALVPRRSPEAQRDTRETFDVDGVTVVGLAGSPLARLHQRRLFRLPRAELFVSVDARFDSWLAMRCAPRARHAVWLLDPMAFDAYWSQHRDDPRAARFGEKLVTRVAFEGLRALGHSALRRADAVWSQPRELPWAARRAARLARPTRFAPCPVALPAEPIAKAPRPLVLFLGRLDWQKQPERFFELARRRPEVEFVAAGAASAPARGAALEAEAAGIDNLSLAGVVTGDELDALLRRAWILCNTSWREGLPRSFLEALAYRCALVAAVDPDGLVSRFGARAPDRDFESALDAVLAGDAWRDLGAAGHDDVAAHYASGPALERHEALYAELVA